MVQLNASAEIYQLHILLLQINPPIWRRLHVPSDSSIAMLHDLLQIAFDWSDFHLHRFVIRGKEYGVSRMGCTTFTTDARKGLLSQFGFRINERFLYEYDFGNVHKALQIVDDLEFALDIEDHSQEQRKLLKVVREFGTYISANRTFIPNYGDRYRHGETISTAFVESAINQVLSKRFVKRQQMRWTERGAHLLLQVRTKVLNENWRSTLSRWYPGMEETCDAKAV
jgi:hypothetical protein